jgi:hypothetical protein
MTETFIQRIRDIEYYMEKEFDSVSVLEHASCTLKCMDEECVLCQNLKEILT